MSSRNRSLGSTAARAGVLAAGMILTSGLAGFSVAGAETRATSSDAIGLFASSTCFVGSSGNCTTAAVTANAGGHFVDIGINNRLRPSPCPWRVRDVNNGVVVRSGTVGTSSSHGERIGGLFSVYQLELRACSVSARGDIDNT